MDGPDEASPPGSQSAAASLCPHVEGRASELSGVSSYQDTNPVRLAPRSNDLNLTFITSSLQT